MNGGVRRFVLLAIVVLALLSAGSSAARTTQATVGVYPSGTTFDASSAAPGHATSSAVLNMPIGGVDDATVLVRYPRAREAAEAAGLAWPIRSRQP